MTFFRVFLNVGAKKAINLESFSFSLPKWRIFVCLSKKKLIDFNNFRNSLPKMMPWIHHCRSKKIIEEIQVEEKLVEENSIANFQVSNLSALSRKDGRRPCMRVCFFVSVLCTDVCRLQCSVVFFLTFSHCLHCYSSLYSTQLSTVKKALRKSFQQNCSRIRNSKALFCCVVMRIQSKVKVKVPKIDSKSSSKSKLLDSMQTIARRQVVFFKHKLLQELKLLFCPTFCLLFVVTIFRKYSIKIVRIS